MILTEAIWEKENIGSNVLEITVEKGDTPNNYNFACVPSEYDYIVVKVPVDKTDFNWLLGGLGYTMIETQVKLSKNINDIDINDRYLKRILPYVTYKVFNEDSNINDILDRITPSMFITDRISLDPLYGPEVGCNRYKKYIRNSFEQNKFEIVGYLFKNQLVGFDMHAIESGVCVGKLGGLFNDIRIPGLGFLTTVAPLLFANEKYGVTKFVPDISTNNLPVLGLYDYFKYTIIGMKYVFVKHQ